MAGWKGGSGEREEGILAQQEKVQQTLNESERAKRNVHSYKYSTKDVQCLYTCYLNTKISIEYELYDIETVLSLQPERQTSHSWKRRTERQF